MGIYTAALNIGSFLTSVVTAPLAEAAGWQPALAASALFAVAAIASGCPRPAAGPLSPPPMTVPAGRLRRGRPASPLDYGGADSRFRRTGHLLLRGDCMAAHAAVRRTRHGAGRRRSRVVPLPDPGHRWAALGVPLVARFMSTTAVALTLGAMWLTVPLGLLFAPQLWWLWSSLGGVGPGRRHHAHLHRHHQAGPRTRPRQAGCRRSSKASGYCFAAAAPTFVGYVNSVTGGPGPRPLLVILGSVLAFILGTTLSVRKVPKQR